MPLPYTREKGLMIVSALVSLLFWFGLLWLWLTAAERYLPTLGPEYPLGVLAGLSILTYLVAYSRRAGRVARLRGHAVEIGPKQHPDLHARLKAVGKRLGIESLPTAYLFQEPRGISFSLRYLGQDILALNGDLVGALTDHQGAIDFFLGYEFGQRHNPATRWSGWLLPASVLPLLGPAYARARTYTCDRFGLEACRSKVDAALALALLASGSRRWKSFNISQYAAQSLHSARFGMSLLELISPQPWLSKRIAHLRAIATESDSFIPRRHPLAYFAALWVPALAWRYPGAATRVLCMLLWLPLLALGGYSGYHELLETGWLSAKSVPVTTQATTTAAPAPLTDAPHLTTDEARQRLDADLKQLGDYAQARFKKLGGNPCEIGNLAGLKLHFRAERYAFSCDEPLVYTAVEAGEFEPARPSYLRSYQWKEGKFLQEPTPAAVAPAAPPASLP